MNDRSYEIILYKVTKNVIAKLIEINNWPEDIAFENFVTSKLYTYLENEETKVWQYSPLMLAQLFNEEQAGNLVLPEV